MLEITEIFKDYASFIEKGLRDRFFKHQEITVLLDHLPPAFKVAKWGVSVEGRSINLVTWGNGPVNIFLWSQMHGDEPTGTMALFDLFNFLQSDKYNTLSHLLKERCTLYIMPMVNPDGAEIFTRRNIQQVDINRDFLATNTPEGAILKAVQAAIKPVFGFNLHDQNTLWSVKGSFKPATLSFLAPAAEPTVSTGGVRKNAKLVIADMFRDTGPLLPGQIGLFDEEYEVRAFGDNFQLAGTSTILIEAGGLGADTEKQEIRKYFFLAMLAGLNSIATGNYKHQSLENYHAIPPNNKKLYHLIINNAKINGLTCSISLNYTEEVCEDLKACEKIWYIHDIGDLTGWDAYVTWNGSYVIQSPLMVDKKADFDLMEGRELILSFKNGILVHSTSKVN